MIAGNLITEALRYGTCCKGSRGITCTSTRLFANGVNHAFAFPAEAGLHLTDTGEMER